MSQFGHTAETGDGDNPGMMRRLVLASLLVGGLALGQIGAQPVPRVLVISIDGMMPAMYTGRGAREDSHPQTACARGRLGTWCRRRAAHGDLSVTHHAHHRRRARHSRNRGQPLRGSRGPIRRRVVLVRTRHQDDHVAGCSQSQRAAHRIGRLARHGRRSGGPALPGVHPIVTPRKPVAHPLAVDTQSDRGGGDAARREPAVAVHRREHRRDRVIRRRNLQAESPARPPHRSRRRAARDGTGKPEVARDHRAARYARRQD